MASRKTVDDYLNGHHWEAELRTLRALVLGVGDLEETVKWGGPCYVCEGANVVSLAGFKAHFGLWFFQGALLDDPHGVLVNAQVGRTRAMRQWRFERAQDIRPRIVTRYLRDAAALARAGRKVPPKHRASGPVPAAALPAELADALAASTALRAAFDALTPGRQREYAAYVDEAKRPETRRRRRDRIVPMIEAGTGLNDRYR